MAHQTHSEVNSLLTDLKADQSLSRASSSVDTKKYSMARQRALAGDLKDFDSCSDCDKKPKVVPRKKTTDDCNRCDIAQKQVDARGKAIVVLAIVFVLLLCLDLALLVLVVGCGGEEKPEIVPEKTCELEPPTANVTVVGIVRVELYDRDNSTDNSTEETDTGPVEETTQPAKEVDDPTLSGGNSSQSGNVSALSALVRHTRNSTLINRTTGNGSVVTTEVTTPAPVENSTQTAVHKDHESSPIYCVPELEASTMLQASSMLQASNENGKGSSDGNDANGSVDGNDADGSVDGNDAGNATLMEDLCNKTQTGDTVRYGCKDGYKYASGDQDRVCQDGKLTGEPLECVARLLGDECVSDADCSWNANSMCYENTCQCVPTHHYQSRSCVEECETYGDETTMYKDMSFKLNASLLMPTNQSVLINQNVTVTETATSCKDKCLGSSSAQVCALAQYKDDTCTIAQPPEVASNLGIKYPLKYGPDPGAVIISRECSTDT